MATIRLGQVRKTFGKVVAVDDLSLEVGDGEFMVFLGPSGCGKTTALRCVAGLEQVDRGRVLIGDRDVTDLAPGRRNIAMVFQSYAVFPHMTVFDNVTFGLRLRRTDRAEMTRRAREAADLLQIADLLDRYPAQLSGGQRQRVAVARAIVMQPAVLLMDEPLSNLDALLRLQMRAELKRIHREIRATTVYVTHDQVEALSLGDRIAVMRGGRLEQVDAPATVYGSPASTFVGSFIGSPPMNFLSGRVEGSALRVGPAVVALPSSHRAGAVLAGIRPEDLAILSEAAPDGLPASVVVTEHLGAQQLVTARADGAVVKVTTSPDLALAPGQAVWLRPDPRKVRLMDPETGLALP